MGNEADPPLLEGLGVTLGLPFEVSTGYGLGGRIKTGIFPLIPLCIGFRYGRH